MAQGKWYFEAGDIVSMEADLESGEITFLRNPITIRGRISSGDYIIMVSTPCSESDMEEIIESLKGGVDAS